MRRVVIVQFAWFVWSSWLGLPLLAQAGGPFVWHEVDQAGSTAVALLWQQGLDEAATPGAARVLAECRLARARARLPGMLASGALVAADATVIFGLVSATAPTAAADFVAALLDDRSPLTDDEIALVVARAALAADDAETLFPGTVLETRARAALGEGLVHRAASGSSTAIAGLTPAMVRQRLLEPVPVWGAALGAEPAASKAAIAAQAWPQCTLRSPVDVGGHAAATAKATPGTMSEELHARVDSPFVAAAFLAPPSASWPQFALGIEVARARAQKRFRLHGRELLAHAPPVRWSWLEGDALVVFCRRGADGQVLLPGEKAAADAEAECQATRRELETLLASLRDEPPTARELATAVRVLQAELALPTGASLQVLAQNGRALPGRLQTWMLATHRGIDVTALAAVTAAEVHDVLATALAKERATWHALLPRPIAKIGWLAR